MYDGDYEYDASELLYVRVVMSMANGDMPERVPLSWLERLPEHKEFWRVLSQATPEQYRFYPDQGAFDPMLQVVFGDVVPPVSLVCDRCACALFRAGKLLVVKSVEWQMAMGETVSTLQPAEGLLLVENAEYVPIELRLSLGMEELTRDNFVRLVLGEHAQEACVPAEDCT